MTAAIVQALAVASPTAVALELLRRSRRNEVLAPLLPALVLSVLALTASLPLGLKATLLTVSVCPLWTTSSGFCACTVACASISRLQHNQYLGLLMRLCFFLS